MRADGASCRHGGWRRSGPPNEVRGREVGDGAAAGEMERDRRAPRAGARAPARAPSSPPAARPQSGIRPASTALAPRASAVATSVPRRMPPSKSTSSRSPTASTIGRQRLERRASRRRADGRRGSRRRCPPAPCSAAQDGILGIEDPLDDDGHGKRRGKPLQVRPVERRVEEVERFACRARVERRRTAGSVPSSNDQWIRRSRSRGPTHGQVDGEEDGAEAGVDRLRDQLVGDAVVAKDVDLEEPRRSRALRPRPQPGSRLRTSRGRTPSRRLPQPGQGPPPHPDAPCAGRRPEPRRPVRRRAWPRTVVSVDADSMPQRTRWRRRHAANAATFSRSVRSAPAPPARYSAQSGSIRASASASTSVSVSGVSTAQSSQLPAAARTGRRRGSRPRTRTRCRTRGSWRRAPGRAC